MPGTPAPAPVVPLFSTQARQQGYDIHHLDYHAPYVSENCNPSSTSHVLLADLPMFVIFQS